MRLIAALCILALAAGCVSVPDLPPLQTRQIYTSSASSRPPTLPQPAPPPLPSQPAPTAVRANYPLHRDITSTVFWIGEPAASGSPSNVQSAWDDHWMVHYGGVDDPARRDGSRPGAFAPRENPFYIALPYHDIPAGRRRAEAGRTGGG